MNLIQPSLRDTLSIGNRSGIDPTGVFRLYGFFSNRYGTVRRANTSAGYVVTALKTLTIIGAKLITGSGTTSMIGIGYGDTDVGFASAALPTNPVYIVGNAAQAFLSNVAANQGQYEHDMDATVPAGKYPFIDAGGGASQGMVCLWCKES